MRHDFNALYTVLGEIGLADVPHTHDDLLAHLGGTYHVLARWGRPEPVAVAGLFHSIYGTEGFPRSSVSLAQRPWVQALIGPEAEGLAYRYCALSYRSLQQSVDEGRPLLEDRFLGGPMPVSAAGFEDLLWVKLADAVEQATEQTPQSRFFRRVAELLGPAGEARWAEAFGGTPPG